MDNLIASDGLRQTIAALYKVDRCGDLEELWADVAAEWRELPADDLGAATPGQRCAIERLAQVAHKMFGVDLEACRAAATQVILTTRRQRAWQVVQRHIADLRERGEDV